LTVSEPSDDEQQETRAPAPPSDDLVETRHTLKISTGDEIQYTVSTGRVVLREQVHDADGYYDCATPFFGAEHAFAHLEIPEDLRPNIGFEYYEAGHMMYVHEPTRLRQSDSLAAFVRAARR